jgi:DNA invertase Pin-like site-specific DNA recombinase
MYKEVLVMDRHVALYARVSTQNQTNGLESQERALKTYCETYRIEKFKLYTDEGISGAKANRPQLDQLMTDVKLGHVSAVIVFSFSRFARSTKHLLSALEIFNQMKVAFVSLSEALDTTTASGKMVFTVLAAVAELERELVRERVKNGLNNARAKGKRLGRPKQQFNTELITHLSDQNMSVRKIAKLAGCSAATVCRELKLIVSKTGA